MNTRRWQMSCLVAFIASCVLAQSGKVVWTGPEQPIVDTIKKLRSMDDSERAAATKRLALNIRELPAGDHKSMLAQSLAGLATEGDPGRDAMQEVATTLAVTLREQPVKARDGKPAEPYVTLAELARFEHVKATVDDPQFAAAMAKLDDDEKHRASANFTLTDLQGKNWTLKDLKGKVVLVNFWATWCPPCRKEMPDLESFYRKFQDQGFVVLGISDEDVAKVAPFIEKNKYNYPILLDPGRKANQDFRVEGIPKSFLYDREGKLVGQAMDMRTERQFSEMLAKAGLR
jgi:peroxiredoxin